MPGFHLPISRLHDLPAEPFDIQGHLSIEPGGYRLAGVEAAVGRLAAAVEGRVGAPSARQRTSLSGRVHGPALSDLRAWGLPEPLPADPFSIAGRIEIEDGVYRADRIVASVGADRAAVDGVLGALPDLSLLDAAVGVPPPPSSSATSIRSQIVAVKARPGQGFSAMTTKLGPFSPPGVPAIRRLPDMPGGRAASGARGAVEHVVAPSANMLQVSASPISEGSA